VVGTETENVMQKDFQEGKEKTKEREKKSRKGRAKSGTLPTLMRKDGYVHFFFFFLLSFMHIEIN
jgi:hypothetical protein